MRERLIAAIKVILFMGVSIGVITYMYIREGKAHANTKVVAPPTDTVEVVLPAFYNQGPKEGLRDALEYYGIHHPDIVYAQAILETGHFKSRMCVEDNNIFGLYNSRTKSYWKFSHWTESVKAYKEKVQYRYKPPNDYYVFLERIHYATDPKYIHKLKQIVKKYGKVDKDASASRDKQVTERGHES